MLWVVVGVWGVRLFASSATAMLRRAFVEDECVYGVGGGVVMVVCGSDVLDVYVLGELMNLLYVMCVEVFLM